uniref:Uncharacterized protein n=1 Tax=Octopus bimaculoides TaxID=37653 RepID=A0A0L8G6I7_OCTBM
MKKERNLLFCGTLYVVVPRHMPLLCGSCGGVCWVRSAPPPLFRKTSVYFLSLPPSLPSSIPRCC